jgi:hypothetical protein
MLTTPEAVTPQSCGNFEVPASSNRHVDTKHERGCTLVDREIARVFTTCDSRQTAAALMMLKQHSRAADNVQRPAARTGDAAAEHANHHSFLLSPCELGSTCADGGERRGCRRLRVLDSNSYTRPQCGTGFDNEGSGQLLLEEPHAGIGVVRRHAEASADKRTREIASSGVDRLCASCRRTPH